MVEFKVYIVHCSSMRLMSHLQGLMFKCLSENILFVVRGQREKAAGRARGTETSRAEVCRRAGGDPTVWGHAALPRLDVPL